VVGRLSSLSKPFAARWPMSAPNVRPVSVAVAEIHAGVDGRNGPTKTVATKTAPAAVSGIGANRGRSSGRRWPIATAINVAVMKNPAPTTGPMNELRVTAAPWTA